MDSKAFDAKFDAAREAAETRRIRRRTTTTGDEWVGEIAIANAAINTLWDAVRSTREQDFRMEQLLWRRHRKELREMKRKMDAVVM